MKEAALFDFLVSFCKMARERGWGQNTPWSQITSSNNDTILKVTDDLSSIPIVPTRKPTFLYGNSAIIQNRIKRKKLKIGQQKRSLLKNKEKERSFEVHSFQG